MSPVALHTVFEALAYAIGFRAFLWTRRRLAPTAFRHADHVVWVGVGAIVGAAVGAKLSFWLDDPLTAFADFPDLRHLLEGKSIIGALLGGLLGVELAKKIAGVDNSTGDAFVLPLTLGMCVGRVGCFLAGLGDHTYGLVTSLPWGVDFGDGVARHPTQLYEIVFLAGLGALMLAWTPRLPLPGDRFKLFMIAYLAFRFAIDFIKPAVRIGGLSTIQWAALAALAYYAPHVPRVYAGARHD